MLKYLTHKLRTQSINEDNVQEKIDGHDSGTESDGDLNHRDDMQEDMELSSSSRHDTLSPTDTVGSSESPAFLGPPHLLYDQHSSEEELEVINGVSVESEVDSPKRSNSTLIIENRKRSLAQSSDDEVRNLLEHGQAPVNFRTSPPLEALKPNRGHIQRATTPLVLKSDRGIGSIRISCDSPAISMDVRSISPPAKFFHCAVSPRRRPPRHTSQRLQRPHRPCLDFDKMQQLKARSVTAWRHNNEHSGELSVFCW